MNSRIENYSDENNSFWKKRRNLVTFLASLGYFNLYALRVNLTVGIVAMTSSTNNRTAEFDWDSKLRGTLLSAFSYGYITTQMVGGTLSTRFGGVKLMGYGVLVPACLTVLTPFAVRYSVYLAIIFTVAVGVFQGISYPSINAVWSRWVPPAERTKLASFAFSGSIMGMIVGYAVCGWLAENYGWEYVFYVPGAVALLWSIIWLVYIDESPIKDDRISKEELEYIVSSIGPTDVNKTIGYFNYPWKDLFMSMPVWAIHCAHFCNSWGGYTLLTQLPSYMNDVLKFDIGKGSYLTALPYIGLAIIIQTTGFLDFWLKRRKILTTTQARKLFNSIAFLSRTVFLYLAAYSTTELESIIYLTLSVALGGFISAGFMVNQLDIAPQYASLLFGISNTFGTIPGFVTPMLTGIIVQNKSADEWKLVFVIASIVHLFGGIFYFIFASGERQTWAEIS
ncbi:Major facilitator superfamily,Major facilitator superfamily domain [Cinara cedri]|uniref:Major facilitator superfamily,Major facilitator superfamily domain n=1 Tax=Cinara cedri TaxID=506608 RepID=A0A5E4N2I8_9HEMI|nr:Major facilitator superfamily,Major facilitator superfamily domain [Cinara cedri]